jgi:hypothetical protein
VKETPKHEPESIKGGGVPPAGGEREPGLNKTLAKVYVKETSKHSLFDKNWKI